MSAKKTDGEATPAGNVTTMVRRTEGGALVAPHMIPGMEGLDMSDFQIPRWRLLQPTSAESADHGAGVLVNTITGEVVKPPLYAIPLRVTKGRLYFKGEKEKGASRALSCRSDDGYTGKGDPGGDCEHCQLGQWGNDLQTGDAEPPSCFKMFGFLVVKAGEKPSDEIDVASIGFLSFFRSSEGAGKAWATDLWMNSIASKETWRRVYAVKAIAVKGEKGLYYQIRANYARAASEGERQAARTWAALLAGKQVDLAPETEE